MTENDWSRLLTRIEEGNVVPVVGPELLCLPTPGGVENVRLRLARLLAERLGVSGEGLDPREPVFDVMRRLAATDAGRHDVNTPYLDMHNLLREAGCEPPEPLLRLAQVRGFRCFLTTTWEPHLEHAIAVARYGGNSDCLLIRSGHIEKPPEDFPLPDTYTQGHTLMYQLFGRSCTTRNYVLGEEDLLHLSIVMFEAKDQLPHFRNYLSNKCILAIGCGYPDWLGRFLYCLIKGKDAARKPSITLVTGEQTEPGQSDHCAFLSRLGNSIFRVGDAIEFIDELHRRWEKRGASAVQAGATEPLIQPWRDGAFFVSYASEDREAAFRLYGALRANGLDVWLDKQNLEAGEDYRKTIFRKINRASFVLALLSRHAAGGAEDRFYRSEWAHAIAQEHYRRETYEWDRFIIPIRVDDVPCEEKGLPTYLRDTKNWLDLPRGEVTAEAARQLTGVLEKYREHMRREGMNL